MRVTCKHCGGAHPAFQCRKKSTAARKDVPGTEGTGQSRDRLMVSSPLIIDKATPVAGTQALPVDTDSVRIGTASSPDRLQTPKSDVSASPPLDIVVHTQSKRPVGRPRTITDMRSYKAAKQREYRERKKSEHQ